MIKVCITIPAELFAKLEHYSVFNRQPIHDTIIEMMALGIFDLEESDAHERSTKH